MDSRLITVGVVGIIGGFIAGMCQPEEYKPKCVKKLRDDIKSRLEKRKAKEEKEKEETEAAFKDTKSTKEVRVV